MEQIADYCLRLNEFGKNIRTIWQDLYTEKSFCDVTLACNEKQIQVHKLVVSSFSPVLKNILRQNHSKDTFIYLKGVKFKDLENLIKFVYKGEVNIAENDVQNFLEVAEDLKIIGLSNKNKNKESSKLEEINLSQNNPLKKDKIDNMKFNVTDIKTEIDSFLNEDEKHRSSNDDQFIKPKDIVPVEDIKHKLDLLPKVTHNTIDIEQKENLKEFSSKIQSKISLEDQNILSEDQEGNSSDDIKNGLNILTKDIQKNSLKEKVRKKKSKKVKLLDNKPKQFKCIDCNIFFSSRGEIRKHNLSSYHYPCDQCSYHGRDMYYLKLHIQSSHEGIRYPCTHCDHKATQKKYLKDHINEVHEGLCYFCPICDHKTTTRRAQKRHIDRKHRSAHERAISNNGTDWVATRKEKLHCEKCEKVFSTKSSLYIHNKTIHEGVYSYCDQCNYKGRDMSSLRLHVESTHDGIRFFCDQCEFKTTQKGNLKHHTKTVHEGFRYSCKECKYETTLTGTLNRHVKAKHTQNSIL